MSTVDESRGRRTPFSAKLPQVSIEQALPVAETLGALGAPATPAVIAQHMGTSRSSSGFKTKLAAAGYYGLIEVDGDRRTLTQRGTDIVSGDPELVAAAKASAVMGTTFGPILYSLRARMANESIVSSRLQGDHSVPIASADYLAGVLIKSADEAGLMTSGKFDAVAIEAHHSVMPTTPPQPAPANGTTTRMATSPAAKKNESGQLKKTAERERPNMQTDAKEATPPFVKPVQVVINVDASTLSAQEIAELVKALQQRPAS